MQCIAKAQPMDLQEKIPYLSKKTARRIIEAAKVNKLHFGLCYVCINDIILYIIFTIFCSYE